MKKPTRLSRLRKSMSCDQLIVENPFDIVYLIGLHLSLGTLIVERRKATLYVDGRYIEMCKNKSPVPVKLLDTLASHRWVGEVGFDTSKTMYSRFTKLKKFTRGFKLIKLDAPVAQVRAIKDEQELRALRKSVRLLKSGMNFIKSILNEGVTEKEVAWEFEKYCKDNGASALSFDPIIAFGEHGAYPHYTPKNSELKINSPVLVDAGVIVDGYCSDMTRVFFCGEVKPKIKKIHTIVKKAQKAAIDRCYPGVALKDVDRAARSIIEEAGFGEAFSHGLGHSLGLEVHEEPRVNPEAKNVLEEGMVITIEPGIYLPGLGGVRYEDMVHVTKNGPVVL